MSLCCSPIADIHSHGSRFPQAIVDQHRPVGPIEFGHLDCVSTFVTPVQVQANPIHRQAIWVTQGGPVQNLPCQSVTDLLENAPYLYKLIKKGVNREINLLAG